MSTKAIELLDFGAVKTWRMIQDGNIIAIGGNFTSRKEALDSLFSIFFGDFDDSFIALYQEWNPDESGASPIIPTLIGVAVGERPPDPPGFEAQGGSGGSWSPEPGASVLNTETGEVTHHPGQWRSSEPVTDAVADYQTPTRDLDA